MCGAYGFSVNDAKEVYDRFEVVNQLADFKPRWNLRPGQMNPVITSASPNQISRMFWGLIPHWAQDKSYGYKTINARSETVAKPPTFKEPLRHKRCIVPATGFYEPDKIN
jgi:putative SOS response-associated peptidase YedK